MSLRGVDGRGKGGDVVRPVLAAAVDAAPPTGNADDQAMARWSMDDLVRDRFREAGSVQPVLRAALDRGVRAEILRLLWVSRHQPKLRRPYDGSAHPAKRACDFEACSA
jgi:hypothetical protein